MRSSVRGFAAAGAGALLLVSCGGGPEQARRPEPGRAAPRVAVSDVPVKIGAPYKVGGTTYTPADDPDYDQVGYASWYGQELSGNDTANGEAFVPEGVTAAHRTLPLPSYVEVTALDTGRTILVRVNDRGPFSGNRLIDLSQGAAQQLGIMGHGATPVRVRRVNPPEQERTALRMHRAAAARMDAPPQLLAGLADRLPRGAPPVVARPKAVPQVYSAPPPPSPGGYMVQVAAFASRDRAQELARRIGARAIEANGIWRVRYGPYADAGAARQGVDLAASKGYADARIVANDSP